MSFEYRTPLANFQSSLSKDSADTLMSVKFNSVLKQEESISELFSYHMSPEKTAYLFERGVYLSPNSVSPHPHPLSKTLENHFLHNLLPMYINRKNSVAFFSCKMSKVNIFTSKNKIDVALVNRIIEAKDASRYAGSNIINKNTPLAPIMKTFKQVFFHDEIHHWSYVKFRTMLSNFQGTELNIFATVVYPTECAFGYTQSMNPLCYTFEVHGDNIYFFPDGNTEGMYVQQRETWIFGTSHIYDEQGRVWTVTKLNSIAAHHLFMITLGEFESPDRYMYTDFTLIPMDRFVSKVHFPMVNVRSQIIKTVMVYLMSLKKPDVNSAVAKVRQLCGKEVCSDEAIFAANLAKNINNCSFVASLGDKFGLEALFDTMYTCCPPMVQRLFDKKKFFSREFLKDFSNMEPLKLTLKRSKQLHTFNDPNYQGFMDSNILYQGDIPMMMDQIFWYGFVLEADRDPQPYFLSRYCHNFERGDIRSMLIRLKNAELRRVSEEGLKKLDTKKRFRLTGPEFWSPDPVISFRDERRSEKFKAENSVNDQVVITAGTTTGVDPMANKLIDDVRAAIRAALNGMKVLNITTQGGTSKGSQANSLYQPPVEEIEYEVGVSNLESRTSMAEQTDFLVADSSANAPESLGLDTYFTLCPSAHEVMDVPGDGNCFYSSIMHLKNITKPIGTYKLELLQLVFDRGLISQSEFEKYKEPGVWVDENVAKGILSTLDINVKVHEDLGHSCYRIGKEKIGADTRCLLLKDGHFSPLICIEEDDLELSDFDESEIVNPHKFDMSAVTDIMNRGLDNACIIKSLSSRMHVDVNTLLTALIGKDPYWGAWVMKEEGGTVDDLLKILKDLGQSAHVHTEKGPINFEANTNRMRINLFMFNGHCSDTAPVDYKVPDFGRRHKDIGLMISSLPLCSKVQVEFEFSRAQKLRDSLLNSYTGVNSSAFKRDIRLRKTDESISREVLTFLGFAGSGKSRGIMNLVGGTLNRKDVLVIVPRVHLKEDWDNSSRQNLEKPKFRCLTFETALKYLAGKETIILDEVTLFPPGYMDLIEYLSDCKNFVVLGDPMQRVYHSKNDKCYLNMSNDIEKFVDLEYSYALYSHRLPEDSHFEIKTMGRRTLHPKAGKIYKEKAAMFKELQEIDKDYHIISPSREMASFMASYCEKKRSMTIGESQGLTFNFVVIVVDIDAKLVDARTWMVALTRSLGGCCFLFADGVTEKMVDENLRGSILYKAMKGIKISKTHLLNSCGTVMRKAKVVESEQKFGAGSSEIEDKLEGDPILKAQINLVEFPWPDEDEAVEPARHDSPPKTHLLLSPAVTYLEADLKMKAREYREFRQQSWGWSRQFNDLDEKRTKPVLNPWCTLFQAIYPKHEGMDDLTFWAAVKKRLVFAPVEKNARALEETRMEGSILFNKLVETYNLKGRPINLVTERVMDEFRLKRLAKSKALIMNHSLRSDPDWSPTYFKLFMKTQLCSKYEKRYSDAKAGQTLACFSHSVLMRFGERCRQFENDFRSDLSENIYIHSQRNFDELNDFVKRKFNSHMGTDSDFEAFDRSQDATILNLELNLLDFYGWPRDLIEDYKFIKLHMGCKLGGMAIMRFTGEFGTFIFNTIANMAFTAMKYELNKNTVLLFAGDDMCSPGKLIPTKENERILDKLNLKAKVNYSDEPMFCGWRLTPYGIYKEPKLILERWLIAEEKGTLEDCLINYSIEATYAYELGDKLYDLIKEIEPYQELVRKIVKKKHKLPLHIRVRFESHGDDFSERGEVLEETRGWGHDNRGCGSLCDL